MSSEEEETLASACELLGLVVNGREAACATSLFRGFRSPSQPPLVRMMAAISYALKVSDVPRSHSLMRRLARGDNLRLCEHELICSVHAHSRAVPPMPRAGPRLGSGSFGVVYELEDRPGTAIKYVSDVWETPIELVRELALQRDVRGEHIVPILQVCINSDVMGILMPLYVCNLKQIHKRIDRPSLMKVCPDLLHDVARALSHIHSLHVMHRDVKPENVLVTSEYRCKLGDFNLSRRFDGPRAYTWDVVTRWYRPPELLTDVPHYDCCVDVWSFGCIAFELFYSEVAFPALNELTLARWFSHLLDGTQHACDCNGCAVRRRASQLFFGDAVPLNALLCLDGERVSARRVAEAMDRSCTFGKKQHVPEEGREGVGGLGGVEGVGGVEAESPRPAPPASPVSRVPSSASSSPVVHDGLPVSEECVDVEVSRASRTSRCAVS